MTAIEITARIVLLGAGATAIMDLWLLLLKRMGVQTLNFAMVGRWVGHLFRGTLVHSSITAARPVAGERALGWLTHYVIGIAFAGALVAVQGAAWIEAPSALPALAIGLCTVAFPLFVMQPAMGLGFAASRTPAPLKSCLRSLASHTVFGLGLYLAAIAVESISR
jgi:hypothetical protein